MICLEPRVVLRKVKEPIAYTLAMFVIVCTFVSSSEVTLCVQNFVPSVDAINFWGEN